MRRGFISIICRRRKYGQELGIALNPGGRRQSPDLHVPLSQSLCGEAGDVQHVNTGGIYGGSQVVVNMASGGVEKLKSPVGYGGNHLHANPCGGRLYPTGEFKGVAWYFTASRPSFCAFRTRGSGVNHLVPRL